MTPNPEPLTDAERAALADAGLPVPTDDEINTFMDKLAYALAHGITDWRKMQEDTDEDV